MIRPVDTGHERFSHRENNILVHICDQGRMNKYTETEIYPIYVFLHHLSKAVFVGYNNLRFKEDNLTASDMESVTRGTSGACVKHFWALENLSRISAKNYPICEIC